MWLRKIGNSSVSQENATHADWRRREASLFAFGSMLDGPEEKGLEPFVAQALAHLVSQLKDPLPHIQDTAAWTIGQAIKFVPGGVVPKEQPQMLSTVCAIHAQLPSGGVHGWRPCPHAQPGCPTRVAPPAAARRLHCSFFLAMSHQSRCTAHEPFTLRVRRQSV